ncbi:MAG: hypothetical protein DSO07_09490 [Thermoproteota archaeon]|jgi:biopolymer transport protein ExbB/TolQ|uniref:Uncharacterized protein n=1 Tax=Candidatus Methanodesulfokora washburnensis TaxID=2478471 RepID=A0A429GVB7_9CREN|nr:hypothetical protein [Candidatus Methanodesulfokores washburnensis]RSN77705.1 hypothetical protein D6D85_02475 [Candidatus Methanodesulfokores washburnensis]RZN62774.1 MAG: hypothetical protein EF810_01945 [Candidatus Methanodesulfokores washburnensis]TDA40312.1 MAG: hypothetical protein DSO07_09490 [Candidatus Korarchaeota archaeon]
MSEFSLSLAFIVPIVVLILGSIAFAIAVRRILLFERMRRRVQNEIERYIQRWRPRIKPVDSMKIGSAKDELKENIPKR